MMVLAAQGGRGSCRACALRLGRSLALPAVAQPVIAARRSISERPVYYAMQLNPAR